MDRGLTGSSVTRNFSYIKAIFNFACSELALDLRNPFIGVFHDRKTGVVERQPIPVEAIRFVQAKCHQIDDDMRWLIALVSDMGMRLAKLTAKFILLPVYALTLAAAWLAIWSLKTMFL